MSATVTDDEVLQSAAVRYVGLLSTTCDVLLGRYAFRHRMTLKIIQGHRQWRYFTDFTKLYWQYVVKNISIFQRFRHITISHELRPYATANNLEVLWLEYNSKKSGPRNTVNRCN